jgi:hypothetical protein
MSAWKPCFPAGDAQRLDHLIVKGEGAAAADQVGASLLVSSYCTRLPPSVSLTRRSFFRSWSVR